ncbi:MAG: Nif3-like dinuclear metal center hexameric protein [Bacteroidota bacterium]
MSTTTLTVKDITQWLEALAPLALQESYDNAGLLTGHHNQPVTKILVSLDATEAVIDEAIAKNCELVIAHHPIIFGGLKKLNGKNYVERTVIKAIKNDIAIYAIHTNLDNVHTGVNQKIGNQLGLQNMRILSPIKGNLKKLAVFVPEDHITAVQEALFAAGSGHIGNYADCSFQSNGTGTYTANELATPYAGEKGKRHYESEIKLETVFPAHLQYQVTSALLKAHPYEEVAYDIYSIDNENSQTGSGMIGQLPQPLSKMDFLKHVKSTMNVNTIRHTETAASQILTVAVCGGAGSFLIKQAIASGADAFVTADVKYHEFFDAENRMMIADIGHYESEIFTKELLKDVILEKFPTFAVLLSETITNPINYFNS